MADLSFLYADGFDTDAAAEGASSGGDFTPVPKGTYRVKVVGAEKKPTKAGNGTMLKVRLDIIGPTHSGRVVFDDILIDHTSDDAKRIGRERFALMCRAAGLRNPKNSEELVGKEMEAFIKVESSKDFGDSNKVSLYSRSNPSTGFSATTAAASQWDDADVPF